MSSERKQRKPMTTAQLGAVIGELQQLHARISCMDYEADSFSSRVILAVLEDIQATIRHRIVACEAQLQQQQRGKKGRDHGAPEDRR